VNIKADDGQAPNKLSLFRTAKQENDFLETSRHNESLNGALVMKFPLKVIEEKMEQGFLVLAERNNYFI